MVQKEFRVHVYRWKCPRCGKELVSLSQKHMNWNKEQHKFSHWRIDNIGDKKERTKKNSKTNSD